MDQRDNELYFYDDFGMFQYKYNINPDYTGVLHVGRFGWVFIPFQFNRNESFFEFES